MVTLRRHLERFAEQAPHGRVFVGPNGAYLRRRNFHRMWVDATVTAGLGGRDVHFHDLRHTGNHLAAATGASTRQLTARMGHPSMRVALIYQHATSERDQAIAAAVSTAIAAHRSKQAGPRTSAGGPG